MPLSRLLLLHEPRAQKPSVSWISLQTAGNDFLVPVVFALIRQCHINDEGAERMTFNAEPIVPRVGWASCQRVAMLWKGQPSLLEQTQFDVHFPTQ